MVSVHNKVNTFIWVPTNTNSDAIFIYIDISSEATWKLEKSHILHVEHLSSSPKQTELSGRLLCLLEISIYIVTEKLDYQSSSKKLIQQLVFTI